MRARLASRATRSRTSFIPMAHSERLVAAYAGDANMVTFGGGPQ